MRYFLALLCLSSCFSFAQSRENQEKCSTYVGIVQFDPEAPGMYVAALSAPQAKWYEKARKHGAIGGKLMGAGGGGFLLFCIEEGKRRELRSAMEAEGLRYMDFQFDWEGSKVLINI